LHGGLAGAAEAAASHDPFAAVRAGEFARLGTTAYLNAASYGPLPERSRRAGQRFQERRAAAALEVHDFDGPLGRAREAAARLVGASPTEIALTPNTSVGLNIAADIVRSHATRGHRTIVVPDREFPANVYGWMSLERDGFGLELVPADDLGRPREDALLDRIARGGVAAVAISAVQFATGYRADLQRLGTTCRDHGALLVVDGIQAVGVVPVDVVASGVDVLACGGQKWLCGPFGTGFAYIRRELCLASEPHRPGWLSFRSTADFTRLLDYAWDLWDDARRFEVGSLPIQGFVELGSSLELILELGVEAIFAHVQRLQEPLLEWARETPGTDVLVGTADNASGIVSVRVPDAAALSAALAAEDIVCVAREGAVRFAPHFYNDMGEMQRVVNVLRART
jgi:cysteine desulfurase / selenocysteine lyase